MTRRIILLIATFLMLGPQTAHAQVVARGFVERIIPGTNTLFLRQTTGTREVLVTDFTALNIEGQPGTVLEVMRNARAEIRGTVDLGQRIHANEISIDQPSGPTTLAVLLPDEAIRGVVVGLDAERDRLVVQTALGYQIFRMQDSPVWFGGQRVALEDLAPGDRIEVARMFPKDQLITSPAPATTVAVVTTPSAVAGMRQTFRQQQTPAPAPQQPTPQQPAPQQQQRNQQ